MNNEYQRGYAAGLRKAWPMFRPPKPPHKITCELMESLESLRDAVDSELATFDPEDEIVERLYVHVDRATAALQAVQKWLINGSAPDA